MMAHELKSMIKTKITELSTLRKAAINKKSFDAADYIDNEIRNYKKYLIDLNTLPENAVNDN